MTQCTPDALTFRPLGSREVIARSDGATVSSDAGGLRRRAVEAKFHFRDQFARCFTDYRDPEQTAHTRPPLRKQRVFALCLGYQDRNDHDPRRHDPLLAARVGTADPTGQDRRRRADRGQARAGKSTRNRLARTPVRAKATSRYQTVVAHRDRRQDFFAGAFLQQYRLPPQRLVLDRDTTDFQRHGHPLGRFCHGSSDASCYLPLYTFWGDHPLRALRRPSDSDAATGALKHLARGRARIRVAGPQGALLVRGDSGCGREHLMAGCEAHGVEYLFGLAKNSRLLHALAPAWEQAPEVFARTGQPARGFKDFTCRTRDSWSRARRVIGQAAYLRPGPNPRCGVTALAAAMQPVYEQAYCGRGDRGNRSTEQQLLVFAERVSGSARRANQVRLCRAPVAYSVPRALRQLGLAQTELAQAQAEAIRVELLTLGAGVRVTVRKVWLSRSASYPLREVFVRVVGALQR
jgi:Transposase DDE domain group 1